MKRLMPWAGLAVAALPAPALCLTENYVPTPGDYVFYSIAFCGLAFCTIIIVAYREYKWLPYTIFSALLLLNASTHDGTFVYLTDGGEFTLWVVPFLVYSITASFGYALVAMRLESPHWLTRFSGTFRKLSFITALFPLTSFLWLKKLPLDAMWVPVNFLFFGMVMAQVLPPLTWQSQSRAQLMFTRAFPWAVGLFCTGAFLGSFVFLDLEQSQINLLNRGVLVVFLSFSLTLVIWQAFNSARARDEAELSALKARHSEAEMQVALTESERQYQRAQQAANRHRSQLAQVSHDLKQPIASLRTTLQRLEKTRDGIAAEKLNHAVEYIDSLAGAFVDTEESQPSEDPGNGEPMPGGKEWVAASVYSGTLSQMFKEEAAQRGVDLTIHGSSALVLSDPLVTMRIISNLVANALAHSRAERVVAGFRRESDALTFEVHDNGVGISDEALQEFLLEGKKSDESEGEGLGLAIVQALCRQQDSTLVLRSEPGKGTCARVDLGPLKSP